MGTVMITNSPISSVSPVDNRILRMYDIMSDMEIDRHLEQAERAFRDWKTKSFDERAMLIHRVALKFIEHKNALGRLCSLEMGKPLNQAFAEIDVCVDILEYYAKNAASFLADRPLETEKGKAFIAYEPLGVILSVQPWNFPYYQVIRNTAPNLMAGNTVVLKHASNVPQCAAFIERIFAEAGAAEGIFTNLYIPGANTDELVFDPRIKGITFTGSIKAGSALAQAAGRVVKKTVIELGGSDAMIILDDANFEYAVQTAAMGRLNNAGQVCTSPKRIIVPQMLYEQFIEACKNIFENVKIGDPLDEEVGLGPLSSTKARDKVLDQVRRTVEAGARLVCGGEAIEGPGAFMKPTILADIPTCSAAYTEEIFGPVLCVYAAQNDADAIRIANDTEFGLGGSVFSTDHERAISVARQIETGMVGINEVVLSSAELPFGGVKNSGYGRELSQLGIYEFVNPKLIRVTGFLE